jgi:hypothetical protein
MEMTYGTYASLWAKVMERSEYMLPLSTDMLA